MTTIRTVIQEFRYLPLLGCIVGAMTMSAVFVPLALAESPKRAELFARKYNVFYSDRSDRAKLELKLKAPSFRTMVETQASLLPGRPRIDLIGGVHQGMKAVLNGPGASRRVQFAFRSGTGIILRVGDRFIVTELLEAQARPMASFIVEGNNGLVTLQDSVFRNGRLNHHPRVAAPYIDTEEGYWLIWADAIAEDCFYQVSFDRGEFPQGLTIVDSERPVTVNTDGRLEVRAAEPRVAFWRRLGGERGVILRSDELRVVMKPRNQGDERAIEAVRRTFKWMPVMRLAAESDPDAFKLFVGELERVQIASIPTPSLLVED